MVKNAILQAPREGAFLIRVLGIMDGIHIALSAEKIGELFGITITNSLIMSLLTTVFLVVFAYILSRRVEIVPGKMQTLAESMVGGVFEYVEETLGSKKLAIRFFPLLMTIFLFILIANLIQFIPGVGSIGFFGGEGEHTEFAPLLRGATTDLNVTLALALISFVAIEFAGIAELGALKYFGKFVNVRSPLGFLIGVIDLFSELARLVSFSFRLFGNIFAGEVMIAIIIFFVPVILPVPLMMFEVFVAFIQAAVFALLTLFFIKIAVEPHEAH